MVHSSNLFVCWWSVGIVCGNSGCFFGCLMEIELCSVCVEGLVAEEWRVLQLFNGSLSDSEGVAEC